MVTQRSIYIIGVVNLILAAIAILCVAQAEDHPEYFSLVYISISIFIFYMITIVCIIILQIIEAYKDKYRIGHCTLVIDRPYFKLTGENQLNPIIIENPTIKNLTKTYLSRSHTLPLSRTVLVPHQTSSMSTSTFKDFNPTVSAQSTFLSRYPEKTFKITKSYPSYSAVIHEHTICPSALNIAKDNRNYNLPNLIKPIPFKYHYRNEHWQSRMNLFDD